MAIYLNEILTLSQSEYPDWTICLNNANQQQIYSFDENRERLLEHISWKRHSGSNTSFRNISTKYCLQFIRLDKDQKWEQWLFLGAYENCGVKSFADGHQMYDLKLMDRFSHFVERLIVEYKKYKVRNKQKSRLKILKQSPLFLY